MNETLWCQCGQPVEFRCHFDGAAQQYVAHFLAPASGAVTACPRCAVALSQAYRDGALLDRPPAEPALPCAGHTGAES